MAYSLLDIHGLFLNFVQYFKTIKTQQTNKKNLQDPENRRHVNSRM